MAHAIAQGAPLKSFVMVAAWMHEPQTVATLYQGEAGVRRTIEAANAVRKEYERTGKVEYIPAASNVTKAVQAAAAHQDTLSDPKVSQG